MRQRSQPRFKPKMSWTQFLPTDLVEICRIYSANEIQAMLVTRDFVGFMMPVLYCSWCYFTFTPTWDSNNHWLRCNDQLIMGVTGADHHRCRRLRSTWRSWRSPVKHPLSQTSQDSVGVCTVHTSAIFMWFAEATRQKRLGVNHTGACCVYLSPTARGVSLHIQSVSVAALSADRRNSVTKQQGDWHPSHPPRRSAWRCTHRWML